jgi:hypothetical protein
MLSKVGVATRAFVVVLLALAKRYKLLLTVNRDSSTEQLVKAYRKLLLKAHPDKGGRKVDFQKLQQAKETWDAVRKGPVNQGGRPSAGGDAGVNEMRYRLCRHVALTISFNSDRVGGRVGLKFQ